MKVWLIRHAIAHERSRRRWPDDSLRPLTPAGRRKFRKAAQGLENLLPRSAPLLTSPFVRARQTADLFAHITKHARPIDCAELGAEQPVSAVFRLLKKRREATVILFGHEPCLGRLLASALGGSSKIEVEFKKGGAACVEFRGRVAPGRAVLLNFLPPQVLRGLR